jgi:hypothetical protein
MLMDTLIDKRIGMKYANSIQAYNFRYMPHIWLAERVGGHIILGAGEPYLRKLLPPGYQPVTGEYPNSPWYMVYEERDFWWVRYLASVGIPSSLFFLQRPEIHASFFYTPQVQDLINDRCFGKTGNTTTKHLAYKWWYPDLEERPKYNGFEHNIDVYEPFNEELTKYRKYNRSQWIEVNKYQKMLYN